MRVIPRVGNILLRRIRELHIQPTLLQALAQVGKEQVGDLEDLLPRERLVIDDLVQPVQELRAEALL